MNDAEAVIRLPRWLAVASLPLAVLLVASLFRAAPSLGGIIPAPWDKLAHLAYYGTVGGLLALGLRRWSAWWPFVLTCLIGVVDESYQSILPGRMAGLDDLAMDFIAAALSVWLVYRFTRH